MHSAFPNAQSVLIQRLAEDDTADVPWTVNVNQVGAPRQVH